MKELKDYFEKLAREIPEVRYVGWFEKLAREIPEVRYVGWDVCPTENGPAII